jgi:PAS domain S-box-containing protein
MLSFRKIVKFSASATTLYRFVYLWAGPRLFRNITRTFQQNKDGSINVTLELNPNYTHCEPIFLICAATIKELPHVFGFGSTRILHSEVSGRHFSCHFIPPTSWKLLPWIRRTLVKFLDPEGAWQFNLTSELLTANDAAFRIENSLQALYNNSPDGMIVVNDGIVMDVNPALELLLTTPRTEQKGKNLSSLIIPEDIPIMEKWLKSNPTPGGRIEVSFIAQDGKPMSLEIRFGGPITIGQRDVKYYVVRDVSTLSRLNAKLSSQQRLAVVGELGATLAHEIMTPLAVVCSNLQSVTESDTGKDNCDLAHQALDHARHIESILQGFSSFVRRRVENPIPTSIKRVVTDSLALCSLKAKRAGVEMECLATDDTITAARAHELVQALVNILSNAIDAAKECRHKVVTIEVKTDLKYISISVVDPGIIANSVVRKNMMEPFFTTKDEGMGLGLAVSRRLIEDHRGTLTLDEHAATTRLVIRLPLA